MSWISNIIVRVSHPRLYSIEKKSQDFYNQFIKRTVFKSKSLDELFSDAYKYSGRNKNTVLVKSAETGNPVPVTISFKASPNEYTPNFINEYFCMFDMAGTRVGRKSFHIDKNSKRMAPGRVDNESNGRLCGIGIRTEQIQVERALATDRNVIERISVPEATLYHIKMGYLPIEKIMKPIKSRKEINEYVRKFIKHNPDINPEFVTPIITRKGKTYYIDTNKTQAIANAREVEHRLLSGKNTYMPKGNFSDLQLSGQELQHWKNLVEKQKINWSADIHFPLYL